jgi:hypothetical protein
MFESIRRRIWMMPLLVAVVTSAIWMGVSVLDASDETLVRLFLVLGICPIAALVCVTLMAMKIKQRKARFRQCLSVISLFAFLVTSLGWFLYGDLVRPHLRWFLWSRDFKQEVMSQPVKNNGEFRHVEWDSWGWVFTGGWDEYIVLDSNDTLSKSVKSNSDFSNPGVPCLIEQARRLEDHWYSVTLQMNREWDRCN